MNASNLLVETTNNVGLTGDNVLINTLNDLNLVSDVNTSINASNLFI